ncbi:MAG TPA: GNAT family N-acetyltransferase [Candidatus Sulfotelmatobacter sp.]
MHLRVGEIHDAEAITALINLAFRVAESFLMDRDRIDLESVQSLLQSGKFLLADHGGAVAGCVYVELKAERAYLGLLSVDPEHQKAGVGSRLMNAAEDHCAKAGCRFMDLQVINLRQELPLFYRNRGYVETGTAPLTPGLRPKLPCHFVKMSKQLT